MIPTAAVWRLWFASRSPRALDARRLRRRRRTQRATFLVGVVALLGATTLLSVATHPANPIFLSEQSTCGSVIRPRHFEAQEGATEEEYVGQLLTNSFASTDCEYAREERLSWVLLLAQVAVLLIAAAVWPRPSPTPSEPAGSDDAVLHPPVKSGSAERLLRHPRITSAGMVAALATISIVITLRVDNSIELSDELNAQAARWLTQYAPKQQEINEAALAVAEARGQDDFPKMAAQCERMKTLVAELDQAPTDLPAFLQILRDDYEAFLEHVDRGATRCIAGARARDDELLQESVPEFRQAAKIAARIESALTGVTEFVGSFGSPTGHRPWSERCGRLLGSGSVGTRLVD